MRKKLLLCAALLAATTLTWAGKAHLTHIKGNQAAGVRYGVGTKNKYDVGITYSYCFGNQYTFTSEVDHEEAVFGYSDFTNSILVSPCLEFESWQPAKWLYLEGGGGPAVGYDKWSCNLPGVNDSEEGIVYGAQIGIGLEFYPTSSVSILLKGQQYLLFGNDDQYLKPNFSIGLRYNFHL